VSGKATRNGDSRRVMVWHMAGMRGDDSLVKEGGNFYTSQSSISFPVLAGELLAASG